MTAPNHHDAYKHSSNRAHHALNYIFNYLQLPTASPRDNLVILTLTNTVRISGIIMIALVIPHGQQGDPKFPMQCDKRLVLTYDLPQFK